MPLTKSILGLSAALLLTVGGVRAARAQICLADADCPQSYACTDTGHSVTATTTCPANTVCAGAGGASGAETPATIKECAPKSCASDADCGVGMICHTEQTQTCSGGGSTPPCAPDTKCDAPTTATETCTTSTVSSCAYKWQLPCSADADCGDAAFACQPSTYGTCSGGAPGSGAGTGAATGSGSSGTGNAGGSSGSSPPSAGDGTSSGSGAASGETAPPVTTGACSTVTSYPGSCQPRVAACTTDSDCPSAWTCTAPSIGTGSVSPGSTGVASGGASGANESSPTRAQTTGGDTAPVAADGGTTSSTGGPPLAVALTCTSPLARGVGTDSKGSTSPDSPGGPASGAGGSTETAGGHGTPPAADNSGTSSSSGGCAIAGNDPGSLASLSAVALLGLVAMTSRRRRSRS